MQLKTTSATTTFSLHASLKQTFSKQAFLVRAFLLCTLLCNSPIFAAEEMTISEFLDAIEENRLNDQDIHELMEGRILSPLKRAQELGRAAVVKRLLSARDANGDTALIKAVASNDIDTARVLLEAGAHPNGANPINILKVVVPGHGIKAHIRNPLGVAALETINQEMVQLLLNYGAFDPTDDGRTLDCLATTVFKCAVYKPEGDSTKRELRDIESMLLRAGVERPKREGCCGNDSDSDSGPEDEAGEYGGVEGFRCTIS